MFSKVSSYIWSKSGLGVTGYDLGDQISTDQQGLWNIYNAVKKSTKEDVTIFTCELNSNSQSKIELVKNYVQKLKTLKHPNILRYIDSLETAEYIYLVTERVELLTQYLNNPNSLNCEFFAYGFCTIAKTIAFLNDCGLCHAAICKDSIFLTPSLDWKLSGCHFLSKFDSTFCNNVPKNQSNTPPEMSNSANKPSQYSIDSWGLATLIWEVFNGDLTNSRQLKLAGKIPKELNSVWSQLTITKTTNRMTASKFLELCSEPGAYFDNWYIRLNQWILELQILSPDQKLTLYQTLADRADTLSEPFCQYKALPTLLNAFEYCGAQSLVLQPLLKIGRRVNDKEFQEKIVPCLVKLFSSPDRSTRIYLLQTLSTYVSYLTQDLVTNQIYPHLVQGFTDTSLPIREYTVQSIGILAPKIAPNLLNQGLLKLLSKSQQDSNPTIRLKTNDCLVKLAPLLDAQTRSKVICSAFIRGIKDSDSAARTASLSGLIQSSKLITMQDMTNEVIPGLAPFLLDLDQEFREKVFTTIRQFIQTIEDTLKNPESMNQKSILGNSTSTEGSWTSWAIGSINSIYPANKSVSNNSNCNNSNNINTNNDNTTNNNNFGNKVYTKDINSTSVGISKNIISASSKSSTTNATLRCVNKDDEDSNSQSDYEDGADGWNNSQWDDEPYLNKTAATNTNLYKSPISSDNTWGNAEWLNDKEIGSSSNNEWRDFELNNNSNNNNNNNNNNSSSNSQANTDAKLIEFNKKREERNARNLVAKEKRTIENAKLNGLGAIKKID